MGARAEQLASKLDQSCREINAAVGRLSDAEWKTVASAEQWSVGVVAHHVAESHAEDEGNARHAGEHANVTKAATLALLQANGAQAVAMLRGLSDAELDRLLGAVRALEPVIRTHADETEQGRRLSPSVATPLKFVSRRQFPGRPSSRAT